MLKGVLIYGNREIARVARDYINADIAHSSSNQWQLLGHTIESEFLRTGMNFHGVELPFTSALSQPLEIGDSKGVHLIEPYVFPSVSFRSTQEETGWVPNGLRRRVIENLMNWHVSMYSIDVPKRGSEYIIENVKGHGCWIQEHCNVQSGAKLGNGVVCWASSHVGHGSEIGNYVWVTTHATICGQCKIGDNVFIGANSVIHPGINIGERCIIGSGAIITKDLPPDTVTLDGRNNLSHKKSYEIELS